MQGDLASGKTTLVKNFVELLGLHVEVTSPTFSLQHIYGDRVYHYDIYNKGLEHFISLGMLEELEKDGFHFVEWGDEKLNELLKSCGLNVLHVEILKAQESREYKIA